MNTMEIDGVKFELILHGQGCTDVPSVICDGKAYIGQAILYNPKKNYEILSFRAKEGPEFAVCRNEDGTYGPYLAIEDVVLTWSGYEIKQVKRLPDGEVFTIGDKCIYKERGLDSIKEFKVEGNSILAYFTSFASYLPHIEKVKNKLFVTSDGVDIHEGDKYWYVNMVYEIHELTGESRRLWNNSLMPNEKTFSTKEAALGWITLNKPCLSVNDILSKWSIPPSLYETIVELAKQKINEPKL